jgi:hypothetical protein
MASRMEDTGKGHFEIHYEAPWGGVASNKSDIDIEMNQFVKADGISIRDGQLCYSNFKAPYLPYKLNLIPPTGIAPPGGYVTIDTSEESPQDVYYTRVDGDTIYTYCASMVYTTPDTSGLSVGLVGMSSDNASSETITEIIDATHFKTDRQSVTIGPNIPITVDNTFTYYDPGGSGAPPQDWSKAYICLVFNCNKYLCAVDQYGFAYIAKQHTVGGSLVVDFIYDQTATDGPGLNHGVPTAVKVVNGVAYISFYGTGTLYAYSPGVSYTVASTYVAGQFIDIFDESMVQLNVNQPGDTPPINPTRINWSGPDEFATWDPSLDRTAGFQSLTQVEDYISGFIAVDNVGYIFKSSGITQITATGVAIQPFNFTTYWNSTIGQGLVYSGTLVQYGRFIFLVTDSNVYMFYGGQFQPIGDIARAAIFSSFNLSPVSGNSSTNSISGGFFLYPYNDVVPNGEYIFAASQNSVDGDIVFWAFNVNNKTWTSVTKAVDDLLAEYVEGASNISINFIKSASVFLNYLDNSSNFVYNNLPTGTFYINFTYLYEGMTYTQTFLYFNIVNTPTSITTIENLGVGNLSLIFRKEEIKLGRQPTITRVVLVVAGGTEANSDVQLSISGQTFSTAISSSTDETISYSFSGTYTGVFPQLKITANGSFFSRIIKVMLVGTYADGNLM